MRKRYNRLLRIAVLTTLLACMLCPSVLADIVAFSADPSGNTANSVWNFTALWEDSQCRLPYYIPVGTFSEYHLGVVLRNCGDEYGTFRPVIEGDQEEDEKIFNPMGAPFFLGFESANVAGADLTLESYTAAGSPCYAMRQPMPLPLVSESDSDIRYDHGLDYASNERVDIDTQDRYQIDYNSGGYLLPALEANDQHPDLPSVIVTQHHPVLISGVYKDAAHNSPVKYEVKKANTEWSDWPNVWVIVPDEKDAEGLKKVYVDYYYPGTHYVATRQAPLALPYTVYEIAIQKDYQTTININKAVFDQTARPMDISWTPLDPDDSNTSYVVGESQLLGIYSTVAVDYAPGAMNMYDPSPDALQDNGSYYTLPLKNLPATGLLSGSYLYVKVATDAVLSVTLDSESTNFYAPVNGKTGAYDAKLGIIKLATPLSSAPEARDVGDNHAPMIVAGPRVTVQYRPLSNNKVVLGNATPYFVTSVSGIYPGGGGYETAEEANVDLDGIFTVPEGGTFPPNTFAANLTYTMGFAGRFPVLWLHLWGDSVLGAIPMFHDGGSGCPGDPAVFRAAVSRGLNMSNPQQWPSVLPAENVQQDALTGKINNKLIWAPRLRGNYPYLYPPMYYAPELQAKGNGDPNTFEVSASTTIYRSPFDAKTTVTVYDSRPHLPSDGGSYRNNGELEMIDYGGVDSDRDWLTCYPEKSSGSWPQGWDVDPLSIEPVEEANSAAPDDGSSSTEFVFRTRYHHKDGLHPLPWLRGDTWFGAQSGVVLYLDVSGTGDYQAHFMGPEDPDATGDGSVYMYRVQPHHTIGSWGEPEHYPIQDGAIAFYDSYPPFTLWDNRQYQSLGIGTYHYFFGCSDDHLKFWNDQFVFTYQPNLYEWGEDGYPSTAAEYRAWLTSQATDPTLPRIVSDYPWISRKAKRVYRSDDMPVQFDSTIYVDRPVRVPGLGEEGLSQLIGFTYPWKASEHPRVTCSLGTYTYNPDELYGSSVDDLFIRYDDIKYGMGRFIGTIQPYYRAVNPVHSGTTTQGNEAARAETCGSTTKTDNVFRVLFQQIDNKPPISIKVYINNASEKTGADEAHKYTAYTMYPRQDQTKPYNYRQGVWYEYKMKLPAGPHTYYFEAYDGEHVVRFPNRPDEVEYHLAEKSGFFQEWWVPTKSKAEERGNEDYFDNDYFPGPYVNNPCVVSEATVTPGTGKEGQHFVYRAKYSDPDGQRPYSCYVYIQINDRGDVRKFQMKPEVPNLDPTENDPETYKQGVYYYLDTATINDLALEKGVRRFYFEFTDDWGRLMDVNDVIRGEITRYPAGIDNWIDGPVISGNIAPTLSGGTVESQDGTANSATLWTYTVNYRDMNNDAPQLMKVYLGLLQADGNTIIWDDGHTMAKTDAGDNVYSDGVTYYFQTRMGAVDKVIGDASDMKEKQYFYAFEAYDGVTWATYRSSSNDELRSNAAGCMVLDDLRRVDPTTFTFQPLIAQQATVLDVHTVEPDDAGDILRISGVYQTEDLDKATDPAKRTSYYTPGANEPVFTGETITLTSDLPAGLDKVWIKYEAQSPIVGPLAVDDPAPAGVIPDAEVFENYTSDPVPILIDDEKNGWVSETDSTESAVLRMRATATYEELPSLEYVMPEYPRNIASVEGVYLTPYLDGDIPADYPIQDNTNYFDADEALKPHDQIATVYQAESGYYARLPQPGTVWRGYDKVLGVYASEAGQGINYLNGQVKWQEANVLTKATIWPTRPYDIAAVLGVYTMMDTTLPDYMMLDPLDPTNDRYVPGWWTPADPVVAGPTVEGLDLAQELPSVVPSKIYIRYIGVGGPDMFHKDLPDSVPLTDDPGVSTVLVHMQSRYHAAGDRYVRLTQDLPIEWMEGSAAEYKVNPSDATLIGEVLGVYDNEDTSGTNYYASDTNPFKAGQDVVYLNQTKSGTVHIAYVPLKRTVYVKYSDIRFTHQHRGVGYEPASYPGGLDYCSLTWSPGSTHYLPDGEEVPNIHFQDNLDDVTGGIVGIWPTAGRETDNLFNPRLTSRYHTYEDYKALLYTYDDPTDDPDMGPVGVAGYGRWATRLSTATPENTEYLYARFYQKGDYHLHRWNRELVFLEDRVPASTLKASYFFGTKMPQTLQYNNPPSLSGGKVAPLSGSRNTQYMYTVTYRDEDGPNGQAPAYVRVYIDGVPHDMTPQNTGTPAYREGAVYLYTPVGGLSGGAHKYHFEASDGAAVAWQDANGSYQSLVGQVVQSIKDFDGPWVNNAPELSDGAANPNDAAGISPWESVDYTVTYKDLDNDVPYVRDLVRDVDENGEPLGVGLSQSPRLWIDAGVNEDKVLEKLYTVKALELDPLDTTSYRVIVAETETGDSPEWETNYYAGKLIQITNGSLTRRVYLVQSNTSDRLTIATNDLDGDGVVSTAKAQADPSLTVNKFRINGLVMAKADPTQVDFTAGVQYKLTVPKLAVGTHKFHFTAISRETKPQWLKDLMLADGEKPLPYSGPVRFPLSGYMNGPTVVSAPPENNSAPVLTNSEQQPLFIGPRVQMANVADTLDTVTMADATKWANIRGVKGVYLSANLDAHLAVDQRTNYFVPADDTEFDGGSITLTTAFPQFNITQELVQSGTVSPLAVGSSLLSVTPDAAGVIGTVTGVYVESTLTGINYYDSFDTATGKIALVKPLPRGTRNVYVTYNWKGGADLPPAYVEYFANQTDVYRQGESLTWRLGYSDADNDPPSYHDSVQGYMRLVLDSASSGPAMLPLNPPVTDYTQDVSFTTTLQSMPTGTHTYHFEGSDGYYTVRYPTGVLGNPAANDFSMTINAKPRLTGGVVDPAGGMQTTPFVFKVTYKDVDGDDSLTEPSVWLRLIKLPDGQGSGYSESVYQMEKLGTGTYADGVLYTKDVTGLTSGRYEVIFEADDGHQDGTPYPSGSGSLILMVRDSDDPPVIVGYEVNPQAARSDQLFTYSAWYMDPDGDAPVAQLNGQTSEGLTLLIDEGQPTAQSLIMTRSGNTIPDYTDPAGVLFSVGVSGKKLGPGNHTFRVLGDDGTLPASLADGLPDYKSEPVLNIPFFANLRAADKKDADNVDAPALGRVAVGQQIVIKGTIKFPYHPTTAAPSSISKVVIQVTKPGGSVISLPATVNNIIREPNNGVNWYGYLTVTYPVSGDPALVTGDSITVSDSGEWVIRAQWAGNSTWDKAETDDNTDGHNDAARVVVGGPARAIAVEDPTKPEDSTPLLDMVTIPMIIGSTDIGQVLGYDKATQMLIARWSPASETYFIYGTQGLFPPLKPGEAFWIKPRTSYPAGVAIAVTDVETGMLTFANNDAKTLDPTFSKKYRLITPLVKAYSTTTTGGQTEYANCEIPLRIGWNQFGNIFFNWKTTAQGKQDIGIPINELRVRYLGQELSISEAKTAGWIKDYAWRYDADRGDYVLVHPTMSGAERTVRAWYGYWIKALVDCQLIINPNTSYTGQVTGLSGPNRVESTSRLDAPPSIPD